MRLAWSNLAKTDLAAVKRYSVNRWGLAVATRYLEDIRDEAVRLSREPGRARRFDERYDFYPVRSHYLILKIDVVASRLIIVRLLHSSMDIERHLP